MDRGKILDSFALVIWQGNLSIMKPVVKPLTGQTERRSSLPAGKPPLEKQTHRQSKKKLGLVAFAMIRNCLGDFQHHSAA
jgi:hypothetical protein